MKLKMIVVLGLTLAMSQTWAKDLTKIKTDKDKLSYSIGVSITKNMKKQDTEFDLDVLIQGMKDGLSGKKLLMTDKEIRAVLNNYQSEIRRNAAVSKRQAMEDNKKKGEEFLAKNKSKPGVITLASGVQYKIVKEGSGRAPLDSELVEVVYRGTLLDGTEFDGTDGHPVNLKANSLIAGWKEVMRLMPQGSKWEIYIPHNLAYGERGVGADIGPNETLIFEVELLSFK